MYNVQRIVSKPARLPFIISKYKNPKSSTWKWTIKLVMNDNSSKFYNWHIINVVNICLIFSIIRAFGIAKPFRFFSYQVTVQTNEFNFEFSSHICSWWNIIVFQMLKMLPCFILWHRNCVYAVRIMYSDNER